MFQTLAKAFFHRSKPDGFQEQHNCRSGDKSLFRKLYKCWNDNCFSFSLFFDLKKAFNIWIIFNVEFGSDLISTGSDPQEKPSYEPPRKTGSGFGPLERYKFGIGSDFLKLQTLLLKSTNFLNILTFYNWSLLSYLSANNNYFEVAVQKNHVYCICITNSCDLVQYMIE